LGIEVEGGCVVPIPENRIIDAEITDDRPHVCSVKGMVMCLRLPRGGA
jgi:hypothetical protein